VTMRKIQFSPAEISRIRSAFESGVTYRELARRFGCGVGIIARIVRGEG